MKKAYLILSAVIITGLFTAVQGQTMKADPEKTKVMWYGEKIGGSHEGTIELKSASLEMKDGKLVSGKVIIDMTTIVDTDIENDGMRKRLEDHLRSDDFFGVDKYPEAVFELTGSESVSEGLKVMGNITIKGNTEPIEFMTSMEESGEGMIFKGKIEIDRTLFDVRFGSKKFFANIGDRAIDDMFSLTYEMYVD